MAEPCKEVMDAADRLTECHQCGAPSKGKGYCEKCSGYRFYVVYDGRAADGDTDRAAVLETVGPMRRLKGAMHEAKICWANQGACLYSYAQEGGKLTDERFEGIVP